MNNQKQKKQLLKYARFSGIAFQMLAIIGIGSYAGVKLDQRIPNKYNLYTVFLSLFAVLLAIFVVIRRIISSSKDE